MTQLPVPYLRVGAEAAVAQNLHHVAMELGVPLIH